MSKLWGVLTQAHTVAGPIMMLLYPLYASVVAMESPSKADDRQWLAYWIFYSFLTLVEEILIQPFLEWVPIWYTVKLVLVTWLVLPYFRGAGFIYDRFVRKWLRKYLPSRLSNHARIFNHNFRNHNFGNHTSGNHTFGDN